MKNKKNGWKTGTPRLVAALPLLLAASLAVAAERPRPESFPDYAKYIQALFDYDRALELEARIKKKDDSGSAASKLCRDDGSGGDGGDDKKKNSCEGKELLVENPIPEEAEHPESTAAGEPDPTRTNLPIEDLDEAIARAQVRMPELKDDLAAQRSTFSSFPLAEVGAMDLSQSGVSGLLGLFNLNSGSLQSPPPTTIGLRPGSSYSLDPDGEERVTVGDLIFNLTQLDNFLLGLTVSGNAVTSFSSEASVNGDSIDIAMSSTTRIAPLYIVDRSGTDVPTRLEAGAIAIDQLGIIIPRLEVNIRGVKSTSNDSLLQIGAYLPYGVTVDFANTRIGASSANVEGTEIGPATDFLVFGPQSQLTVAGGTRVTMELGVPDYNTPLLTLNGRIGEIVLNDMSLLSRGYSAISIGRITLRNINLVNTRVYVEEDKFTLDAGTGLTNVELGVERVYLGSVPQGGYVGDFYMKETRVHNLRMTAAPH